MSKDERASKPPVLVPVEVPDCWYPRLRGAVDRFYDAKTKEQQDGAVLEVNELFRELQS